MEVRADAAYRVTRDLSLRFGFEFMDFGKGIGRGIDTRDTSQDVIMYGATMGVTSIADDSRTARVHRTPIRSTIRTRRSHLSCRTTPLGRQH